MNFQWVIKQMKKGEKVTHRDMNSFVNLSEQSFFFNNNNMVSTETIMQWLLENRDWELFESEKSWNLIAPHLVWSNERLALLRKCKELILQDMKECWNQEFYLTAKDAEERMKEIVKTRIGDE